MKKVDILIEALPYIKAFKDQKIVIKYGGHAMLDKNAKEWTTQDVILLHYVGMNPIIIHGGGPEITNAMKKMGKKPTFVRGLRVTDEETLEIVKMVMVGKINTDIVSNLSKHGVKAIGISGKDGQLLIAKKKAPQWLIDSKTGEKFEVDLGLVGETERINPEIIDILVNKGYIPVISPIGIDTNGNSLNLNADTVAGEIAASLKAKKLIILTDVKGVLKDPKDPSTIIKEMTSEEAKNYIEKGLVTEGMIPKLEACIRATESGVEKAHIIDGRIPHSLLLEIFTDEGIGTMVKG
ncbi:MAG: acetylglutamate kinase [Candidatus Hydrothermarchaeota archaeon]